MVASPFLTTLLLALATAISSKPVFERKSPAKSALTRRLSPVSYNRNPGRDLRRESFHRRHAVNHQDRADSTEIKTSAIFQREFYSTTIAVGEPPTSCK